MPINLHLSVVELLEDRVKHWDVIDALREENRALKEALWSRDQQRSEQVKRRRGPRPTKERELAEKYYKENPEITALPIYEREFQCVPEFRKGRIMNKLQAALQNIRRKENLKGS